MLCTAGVNAGAGRESVLALCGRGALLRDMAECTSTQRETSTQTHGISCLETRVATHWTQQTDEATAEGNVARTVSHTQTGWKHIWYSPVLCDLHCCSIKLGCNRKRFFSAAPVSVLALPTDRSRARRQAPALEYMQQQACSLGDEGGKDVSVITVTCPSHWLLSCRCVLAVPFPCSFLLLLLELLLRFHALSCAECARVAPPDAR